MPVVTTPSTERRACRPTTSTPSSASATRRRYGPGQGTWVLWRELTSWMRVEVKKRLSIIQAHSGREEPSRTKYCSLPFLSKYAWVLRALLPSDRHDALFVVGSLDETLELRGLRYHPIDIETSVSRAHRSIAERWDRSCVCWLLVSLYCMWLCLFISWGRYTLLDISAKGINLEKPELEQSLHFISCRTLVTQKKIMHYSVTNGSNMSRKVPKEVTHEVLLVFGQC